MRVIYIVVVFLFVNASFAQTTAIPQCTSLSNPINSATNVAINSTISWNTVSNTTGYFLSIGTTSGGTQIANMIDVGTLTSYNSGVNFAQNTTYFITITPYNVAGNASGCLEESFTTETISVVPNCTSLSSPLNNATNISINSNISWNISSLATGYFIIVGTSPSGGQIENMLNVGNVTTYNPPANAFSQFPIIYVTVIPYNLQGNAVGCYEESFSTELANLLPNCTNLSFPLNGQNSISVDLNSLVWNQPQLSIVDGYFLSIGTTPNGLDIINNKDVGNTTNYTLTSPLPYEATLYVTVIPYNSNGLATGCQEEFFETILNPEPVLFIPSYFTPNGDNSNDEWLIEDNEGSIKTTSIFDRFGKLLEVLNSNEGWNATYNGKKLQATDYWYVIELKNNKLIKGHFSLKR